MRRSLATTALVVGTAFAGAPLVAAPALASADSSAVVVASAETDTDEPAAQDGNDDTGKYGLIGLTGLLGLFGYKKYRDSRAARTTGTVGDVDGDGSGSRRVV
jgi:hypothetical protein